MADIREITVAGTSYSLKDSSARDFMDSSSVTSGGVVTINGTSFTAAAASTVTSLEARIAAVELNLGTASAVLQAALEGGTR